jgi:hypothetical protein
MFVITFTPNLLVLLTNYKKDGLTSSSIFTGLLGCEGEMGFNTSLWLCTGVESIVKASANVNTRNA